ncbi:argonaute-like protein [Hymenopellis radicata]|nr:argonaute-like protein [Hymenopellis radicata]
MSGRGSARGRGAGPAIRGARGAATGARGGGSVGSSVGSHSVLAASHVETVGQRRLEFGRGGRPLNCYVNYFEVSVPTSVISHYDVVILPSEKTLPARFNMDLIKELQSSNPLFNPKGVYDGRKNFFTAKPLDFNGARSQEFDVMLGEKPTDPQARGPKVYKIRLTKVAEINPETLQRFVEGKQSQDNHVLTAITALNVVIRMEPSLKYPFNVRSFFTDRERKDIGSGLELWRGYFSSVRGRMLINIDISTGTMYKGIGLLELCLEFIGQAKANTLSPRHGFPDRERLRLQRFISGIRVITPGGATAREQTPRVIKKLSPTGANNLTFQMRDGGSMTVANYFQHTLNRALLYPDVLCVEVGSGALIPLELCKVAPGQIMRKQVPSHLTKDVLTFATKRPSDRRESIRQGLEVLAYGQSEYVKSFGMEVNSAAGLLQIQARVLTPPTLKYGRGSKQATVQPRDGSWNMVDKKFFKPTTIKTWILVIYERRNRFDEGARTKMIDGLMQSCRDVGITIDPPCLTKWENGQGVVQAQLGSAGLECRQKTGNLPQLIVVVLPENGNDIYTAVKHFGDITAGVATQCMKSSKCWGAKSQYYANVCLKINVKMGGINVIPDAPSVRALTDPSNPTIVMGADVIHPAPGSDGRPSFTALVANVDSDSAKYIATTRVQNCRVEMIEDLRPMAKHAITSYMGYRSSVEKVQGSTAPKRIIFYRDGVSEGQFAQVLDQELKALKGACEELRISPKITIIVVGKRHHVRFFPSNEREGDRSGNCPAGTVVDRDVTHPTEFDFYLQSHGGLLGTSRPAHYSVLYDENKFDPDAIQNLSFALCHVYARSTRSVSIPAPVYYADIVCSRAKNHYDPSGSLHFSESASQADTAQANDSIDAFRRGFRPLHSNQSRLMYFS